MPKKLYFYLSTFCTLLLVYSCREDINRFEWTNNHTHTEIFLKKESDSLSIIHLSTNLPSHTTWNLPYPVYQFDYGDITGDGIPEIAVGVVKPTRFNPKPNKRLFLYRIAEGIYIRPLWLGSRVAQPLEDFKIIRKKNPARIRTLEKEYSGKFLIAEYQWKGFGLEFKKYLKREINEEEARKLLKK